MKHKQPAFCYTIHQKEYEKCVNKISEQTETGRFQPDIVNYVWLRALWDSSFLVSNNSCKETQLNTLLCIHVSTTRLWPKIDGANLRKFFKGRWPLKLLNMRYHLMSHKCDGLLLSYFRPFSTKNKRVITNINWTTASPRES